MNGWALLPLPIVAASSGSTASGFDAINVGNDYEGVVWRSVSAGSIDLIVDLGSDGALDTLMMFGLSGPPTAATMQLFFATAAQGSSFSTYAYSTAALPLYAGATPLVSGKGVALWTAPDAGFPAAVRYILIRFDGPADYAAEVGRVAVGQRLRLSRNFAFGGTFGVRDFSSVDFSSRGALIRRRGKKRRVASISFPWVAKEEIERQVQPLLELAGNSEPIALVTDPAPDDLRQRRCYFGPLVGDLGTTWRVANGWEWRAGIVSLF